MGPLLVAIRAAEAEVPQGLAQDIVGLLGKRHPHLPADLLGCEAELLAFGSVKVKD